MAQDDNDYTAVIRYHKRTKHHLHRYARSPGRMDWENQPTPFRFYEETAPIPLPLLSSDPAGTHADLYHRSLRKTPFTLSSVGGFLELSLGLSAWKSTGDSRWALRINPSSGNLHPTEAHLVLPELKGLGAGLYHYNPFLHALEPRAKLDANVQAALSDAIGGSGFQVGVSSIFWRESWKYGERAFRYCQLDAGHALAALRFSANLMGWCMTLLSEVSDRDVERVLGLDRTPWFPEEREHGDYLCAVHLPGTPRPGLPERTISALGAIEIAGKPNRLSPHPVPWPVIDEVAGHSRKSATPLEAPLAGDPKNAPDPGSPFPAAQILRRRRSAVSFDPAGGLSFDHFLAMLDKTRPRSLAPPFDLGDAWGGVQLAVFVHRVEGIEPGLYLYLRDPSQKPRLQASLRPEFSWTPIDPEPALFLLKPGPFRKTAMMVSCHQEIAGFSAFSLGMIARFEDSLRQHPWRYRHLFWEAGMIGQVLYLEAEARGLRGTGIGCFFDDAVHDLMGIANLSDQSLYHFTVGKPVEDPRLSTLAAYHHLDGK